MDQWRELLYGGATLLADGAMGTMLYAAGLQPGESPVSWNTSEPDKVRAVHSAYLAAGAQVLITNTFVGSRFALQRHGLGNRAYELNRNGAALLREEVDRSGRSAIVAGDIGPSGEMLAPLGSLAFEDAVEGFEEQARGLIDGGADVIWTMTLSDLEEGHAVIQGVRRVSADIPIFATMTFDRRGRTMMGVTPEVAARALIGWGATAIGGNCGNGPDEILDVIERMHAVAPQAILIGKSNAGKPEIVDGVTVFPATPGAMAESAAQQREAGARIIGGCCGTNPAHIVAMRATVTGKGA